MPGYESACLNSSWDTFFFSKHTVGAWWFADMGVMLILQRKGFIISIKHCHHGLFSVQYAWALTGEAFQPLDTRLKSQQSPTWDAPYYKMCMCVSECACVCMVCVRVCAAWMRWRGLAHACSQQLGDQSGAGLVEWLPCHKPDDLRHGCQPVCREAQWGQHCFSCGNSSCVPSRDGHEAPGFLILLSTTLGKWCL